MKPKLSIKKFIILSTSVLIYLLGGAELLAYISIGILFFITGSTYKRFRIEYEDYKIMKNVQKSMIKLDDYKQLKSDYDILKSENEHYQKTIINLTTGGVGGLAPPTPPVVNTKG
ncbi:MAG: hypothetical protein ACRCST_17605 [Turicibacter sp.]